MMLFYLLMIVVGLFGLGYDDCVGHSEPPLGWRPQKSVAPTTDPALPPMSPRQTPRARRQSPGRHRPRRGDVSGVPTPSGSAHQGWPEPPVEKTTPPVCCQPPTAVLQTQNSYSLVHLTPQRSATIHDSDEPTNRSGSTYTHFHINPCESLFKNIYAAK